MAQKVLVVGPAGRTGICIVEALLATPNIEVLAGIRPSSLDKPSTADLKAKGATIIPIDVSGPEEALLPLLEGVDTVICALDFTAFDLQIPLITAAKAAGVKRFVPCDFATPCVRGVRSMFDQKLKYHDLIEEIGLGHTYIDVGWWMELAFPVASIDDLNPYARGIPETVEISKYLYEGSHKGAFTDRRDIGPFVARIITDPRTLDHYVLVWGEELTQADLFALSEEVSGKKFDFVKKTGADLKKLIEDYPTTGFGHDAYFEYLYSMWIRGDNNIESAKKPEYGSALDAKELYPDIKVRNLRDAAKEFYHKN